MAGHSKFKKIAHHKGAQDQKRANIFTKLSRELYVAAKAGLPDPNCNARLKTAIAAAKAANMPKDKIASAMQKATSHHEGVHYEEMRYEGYMHGGVAFIIETLTDNKNRTSSDIRAAFHKYHGSLAENGSVSFMFSKVGIITYPLAKGLPETFLQASMEAQASDCISDNEKHTIICSIEAFNDVREKFEHVFGIYEFAGIIWRPNEYVTVDSEQGEQILKFVEVLEDNDDVQYVASNFKISGGQTTATLHHK
ncbi:YebC/PmpR family DNA-binding transcriptional regulator [Rickettsiales endosymbiont of Peranema trichophorum]|uniref:YebC/PmpR family DNA-binding transcriptional regulator n=1 Tax=Rickettsiales endosymbiont of Peranema trichophorum TaxID=2486577 RepID=UPI00102349D9|nr:YebC/PmpR family DNA-binding transcriptional regulator [Rickettsiales endosymbiont of Peranema trichophorum]RZI45616.1 YebC/PmpR family DNA-binding transcriptional regulator [Rickettsiales endosymbiont of Peranema trichophorum]